MNLSGLGKAHLVFGGMDIDIDPIEGDFDKQNRRRVAPLHEPCAIAGKKGVLQHAVLDPAAVDKEIDSPGGAPAGQRRADPA